MLLMPNLFYNFIAHDQWIIFLIILIYCIFEPLFYLCWASKTVPFGTVLSLGLENIFWLILTSTILQMVYCLKLHVRRNRIFIVFFTCKVYIGFIPFICVTTCILLLMLSISITQLFKKIMNSIQGLVLFPIILAQLNYFFSKNLKLNL